MAEIKKVIEALQKLHEIEEADVFDTIAFLDEVDENETVRIETIAAAISDYQSEIDIIESQIKSQKSRQAELKQWISTCEQYLDYTLAGEALKTRNCEIKYRKSSEVEIYDEAAIPSEYITEKVTHSVNKTAIKKAINDGNQVPGARVNEKNTIKVSYTGTDAK